MRLEGGLESNMNENGNKVVSVLGAFLLGGLIGAGIALLMAPQSGEEMRSRIRDRSVELKDKAVEAAEDTRQRASQKLDDIASQTKDKVASISSRS
jgi:gas vesicle protein